MAEWPDNYVQANGLNIHYYRTGNAGKPVIILLHGVMDNGLCWTPVARDLQGQFDVIMTDARGHGRTGGSLEGSSYKLLADDVAAFIRALGLGSAYLFGHSMGAMTAAVVAANYPELVRALVLEDPPFRDEEPDQDGQDRAERMLQFFQGILDLRNLSSEERLVAARKYNPRWDEVELAPWAESKVEFNPEVFQHLERDIPWREILSRIRCPLLLVTGDPEAGAIVAPQAAQEAMYLCKRGEVIHIAGAGHCIHRDRYTATTPQIQNFLRRV